jgi:thiamine biosynthesis lipoprotein
MMMDTTVTITTPTGQEQSASDAARMLTAHSQRVWPLIDVFNPSSEISRANQIASVHRFPISRDTERLLDYALRISRATNGAFDITAATLLHVWRLHWDASPGTALPAPLIAAARLGVGAAQVDLQRQSLSYRSDRTQLDVNAFARAYVLDLTTIQLRRQSAGNVLVQVGSISRCLGRADDHENWTVALTHPYDASVTLGHFLLPDSNGLSIMSMADLAITIEGERVSRLIDPRTGALAKGTALTAVMGPTATESFALSEALFVSGAESMPALNKAFPRYHLLIIPETEPLEIWISRDAAPFFRPTPAWADRIRIGTPPAELEVAPEVEAETAPEE